jgi:hypothetical protein
LCVVVFALISCPSAAQHHLQAVEGSSSVRSPTYHILLQELINHRQTLLFHVVHPTNVCLQAVEGSSNVRSPTYHQLLQELITEAERNAHKPQQRLIFMGCLGRLLPCIGLYVLRHTAALLPLLLEWSHAYDEASAVTAVRLLECVVQQAWPRMGVHAGMIWRHLVEVVRGAEERRWLEVGRREGGAKGVAVVPAKGRPCDAAETAAEGAAQHSNRSAGAAVDGFDDSVLVGAVLDVARLLVPCGTGEFAAAVAATAAAEPDEEAAVGDEQGDCSWVCILLSQVRQMQRACA